MTHDLIQGKTIRFTFDDGQMAHKTFEHVFREDGTVSFRMLDDKIKPADASSRKAPVAKRPKYEAVELPGDMEAVSYLSEAGYTLTTMLDFKTNRLVAFSSNEKTLGVQHGTFEVVDEGN